MKQVGPCLCRLSAMSQKRGELRMSRRRTLAVAGLIDVCRRSPNGTAAYVAVVGVIEGTSTERLYFNCFFSSDFFSAYRRNLEHIWQD